MENASKALLMAGGVLLAILIISLVLLLNTSITNFENAQNNEKEKREIVAFNREYEAYNKSVLHGTDIITVVNKAIEHNKKMSVSESETPYYINIKIEIPEDNLFVTTGKKINNKLKSGDEGYETDMVSNEFSEVGVSNYSTTTSYGLSRGIHSLGEWESSANEGDFQMNTGIISFFGQDVKDIKINSGDYTYYIYSGLTNFKRGIFECTGVGYSNATGRINEMSFKYLNN